ncbi:ERC protein [Daphnia magna]|uniref:ERC protein n=1 Tax=Daphnia magna TaxID=35525 RepID=A0A164U3L4_9CRUS|nr:ERC protein [Daphnia magna]
MKHVLRIHRFLRWLMNGVSFSQKQAMLVRQLEEELRIRSMQNHHPSHEVRQQVETMYAENDHLSREVAILRETVKELELRIETQKQTLQSRDESIKKLLEMLQNKGMAAVVKVFLRVRIWARKVV